MSDYGRFGPASMALAPPPSTSSSTSSTMLPPLGAPTGYTREELINFWKDLSVVAKRALLRIHREVYLTALDQFLVRQNLCCECHDNVIAEWEDHERRRSGTRSLQDVFSVFPPFMDDEDDDDDDEDDEDDDEEDDEGDETEHERRSLDSEDELLEAIIDQDDDEVVFNYELEGGRPLGSKTPGMLSGEEYLAALEDRKRSEVELMRLIQKEERYIIIREDHTDFIIDLIRCGEQFSYVSPCRPTLDDDESDANDEDEDEEEDEDDDGECPGANTSHLAQEYLLEVLAIKFREQVGSCHCCVCGIWTRGLIVLFAVAGERVPGSLAALAGGAG